MLKDALESFKDNLKEKVTNPFLGSFILVWVVHNWQIVYAFFYFDKDYNLDKKIKYFIAYWTINSFIKNLFIVGLIALAVMIATFIFLSLARYLSNIYSNVLIPNIDKYSKGNIVTNETYQTALDKIVELQAKMEEERKQKNNVINERDEFERRLSQSGGAIAESQGQANVFRSDSRFSDIKNSLLEIKKRETLELNLDTFIENLIREQSVFRTTQDFATNSSLDINEAAEYLAYLEKIGFLEKKDGRDGILRYKLLKIPIVIYSAVYGVGDKNVDVTNKIREMVRMDIFQGQVNPGYLGVADPAPGLAKSLKIHCRIRGNERTLDNGDGEVFQIK